MERTFHVKHKMKNFILKFFQKTTVAGVRQERDKAACRAIPYS
jgi:hypothetical protein